MIMSATWRTCAISAALSKRDMKMAGRKVLPMVEKKVVLKDALKDELKDEKKDEKKDELKDEKKVVPKEPKMRRRLQPVVSLQWASLPSNSQQQPSCHYTTSRNYSCFLQ